MMPSRLVDRGVTRRPRLSRPVPRRFPVEAAAPPNGRRPRLTVPVPVALALAAAVFGSPVLLLSGVPTWWFVRGMQERRRRRRAEEALESEVVDLVDALVQQLRSGSTLSAGFLGAVEGRDLARLELVDVLATVAAGHRLPDALDEMARRPSSPEPLRLLGTAVSVLAGSGGPRGPALERLSETLRANRAARAEAVGQASQAFASATMLAVLPLVFAALIALVEPAVRRFYLFSSAGALCVTASVTLVMIGWRWTERTVWGSPGPATGRRGRWAAETASAALASVIDLTAVVLGSGGTTGEALRVVGARGPLPIRPPVGVLLERWRSGVLLSSVLVEIPEVLGEDYRPLAAALASTERDGAPVASLLVRLGDEARTARRRQAEIRARRMSVQLLLPLVCCSLPAVLIGAVLPLVVVSIGRF